eukprot:g2186.t1
MDARKKSKLGKRKFSNSSVSKTSKKQYTFRSPSSNSKAPLKEDWRSYTYVPDPDSDSKASLCARERYDYGELEGDEGWVMKSAHCLITNRHLLKLLEEVNHEDYGWEAPKLDVERMQTEYALEVESGKRSKKDIRMKVRWLKERNDSMTSIDDKNWGASTFSKKLSRKLNEDLLKELQRKQKINGEMKSLASVWEESGCQWSTTTPAGSSTRAAIALASSIFNDNNYCSGGSVSVAPVLTSLEDSIWNINGLFPSFSTSSPSERSGDDNGDSQTMIIDADKEKKEEGSGLLQPFLVAKDDSKTADFCVDYQLGQCKWGESCRFSHVIIPSLRKDKICKAALSETELRAWYWQREKLAEIAAAKR